VEAPEPGEAAEVAGSVVREAGVVLRQISQALEGVGVGAERFELVLKTCQVDAQSDLAFQLARPRLPDFRQCLTHEVAEAPIAVTVCRCVHVVVPLPI
jgi:hypothetical protein